MAEGRHHRGSRTARGHSIPANKTPFTDDEINRILAACDKFKIEREQQPGYRQTGGEDLKDFIYVMLYTGMRISDVTTFDTSLRLNGNEIFMRMHKTKKELFTWVPASTSILYFPSLELRTADQVAFGR